MTKTFLTVAIVSLASAAGCSSVALHYHTLLAPQELQTSADRQIPVSVDVRVAPLPAVLIRHELVIRTGTGEMSILDNDRWASPLGEEIRESVRFELQNGLGRLEGATPLSSAGTMSVDLAIERFESAPGRYVAIVVAWSAKYAGVGAAATHPIRASCTFSAYEPAGEDYPAMVRGYQRELKELAAVIIKALESPPDAGGTCPAAT